MVWDDTLRTSGIFECELSPAGVRNVHFLPVFINDDFQPTPLSGLPAAQVLQDLAGMGRQLAAAPDTVSPEATAAYAERADIVLRHIRAKTHRFFRSNFWRYPAGMLVQQLVTYARNRVHERVIAP